MSALEIPTVGTSSPNDASLLRTLVAAALSACVPGSGQLLLGKKREGTSLLIFFALLVSCLTIFRLPKYLLGFQLVGFAWAALSFGASAAAFYDRSNPRRSKLWWIVILLLVFVALNTLFVQAFRLTGFRAFKINSSAMQPTLYPGDRIGVDTHSYRADTPQRNDIIAINRGDFVTFRRVIAIGGDTIAGKDAVITANGTTLNEPFIQHSQLGRWAERDTFGPITVPAGKYFVMGDSRDVSLDSRDSNFGFIDSSAIVGKFLYIYRSPSRQNTGKYWKNPLAIFKRDK